MGSMRVLVYVQCMDGEFFLGNVCPNDGWVSPLAERVANAVSIHGTQVTLDLLRAEGLTDDELDHVLIVHQSERAPVFDVLFIPER